MVTVKVSDLTRPRYLTNIKGYKTPPRPVLHSTTIPRLEDEIGPLTIEPKLRHGTFTRKK